MKIIIIEDEHLTAEDLRDTLLEINPEIEIVTTLSSVKESINYLSAKPQPDLIFSDIQLGDGLSFDIFAKVNVSAPIIFCTAYDEYALEAFKTNGIHYVLKPFDKQAIKESLDKYDKLQHSLSEGKQWLLELQSVFKEKSQASISTILVYNRDMVIPIKLTDIALFYIESGLTRLQTFNKEKYIVEKTLSELEQNIGDKFFRVNRQYIVNKSAVASIKERLSRKADVILNFSHFEPILLSKEKITPFLKWLEK